MYFNINLNDDLITILEKIIIYICNLNIEDRNLTIEYILNIFNCNSFFGIF